MIVDEEIKEIVDDSSICSVEIGMEFSQEKYEKVKKDLSLKIIQHYLDTFNEVYRTNLKITKCQLGENIK